MISKESLDLFFTNDQKELLKHFFKEIGKELATESHLTSSAICYISYLLIEENSDKASKVVDLSLKINDLIKEGINLSDHLTKEEIKKEFERLYIDWREETGGYSMVGQKVHNEHYGKLVKMGWAVVPFMLDKLINGEGVWLYLALRKITGDMPDKSRFKDHSIDTKGIKEDWTKWGKEKGLI